MTEDELRALIAAHPVEGTSRERRAGFEALARAGGAPDLGGIAVTEGGGTGEGEGAPYLVLQPEDADGPPIVHLHGGGYVFGSPQSHLALGAELARAARRSVILLGYPLAPEAPWPAQRDAVMAFLAALGPPFVLSGDSAGGHLALACAVGGAKAEALVLFSPNTSRAYGLSRTRGAAGDAMNDHETDAVLSAMAFGGVRPADPDQTLTRQDMTRLPRTFVDVGTDEVLLDDTLALTDAMARQGVSVTTRVRPGFHMIQLFAASYEPGRASLRAAARWLVEG